ncbi:MAG: hypothetical protein MK097_16395, partial [Dechloromonas sp.]|nr:hypothetical protein [Dechloromonas sp.]
ANAMYPGFTPSTLANMAAPKVLAVRLKTNFCVYAQCIFVAGTAWKKTNPRSRLGTLGNVICHKRYSISTEHCLPYRFGARAHESGAASRAVAGAPSNSAVRRMRGGLINHAHELTAEA